MFEKKGCFHELVLEIEKKGVFELVLEIEKRGVFSGHWGPCLQFSVFHSDVNWKLTKQKYSRLDSIRIRLTIDDGLACVLGTAWPLPKSRKKEPSRYLRAGEGVLIVEGENPITSTAVMIDSVTILVSFLLYTKGQT